MDGKKVIDGIEETISYLRCHVGTHIERLIQHQNDAITMLKEQPEIVRCKDCDNKECCGRAGKVVCGIDGTPHRPDWFCAYGERES